MLGCLTPNWKTRTRPRSWRKKKIWYPGYQPSFSAGKSGVTGTGWRENWAGWRANTFLKRKEGGGGGI